MRRGVRAALTAVLVCAFIGLAGPASAHNVLTGSTPADGARLATAPRQVTLTFNQPVRHGYDAIAITGPGGGKYDTGRTTVDDRTVRVRMREPGPAGRYTIGYRILSADGHPVTGSLHFTLTAPGPAKPAPPASALGVAQEDGAGLTWVWIAGATLVVMLAVVLLLRRNRARS